MADRYNNAFIDGTGSTTSYVTLYQPAADVISAVASTFAVTNRGTTASTFGIAIDPLSNISNNPLTKSWIAFNVVVSPGDTIYLTIGAVCLSTQVIRVYSSTSTTNFSVHLLELLDA